MDNETEAETGPIVSAICYAVAYLPLALLMAGIFSGSQTFIALLVVAFVIAAILWVMSRTISFLEDIASLFR